MCSFPWVLHFVSLIQIRMRCIDFYLYLKLYWFPKIFDFIVFKIPIYQLNLENFICLNLNFMHFLYFYFFHMYVYGFHYYLFFIQFWSIFQIFFGVMSLSIKCLFHFQSVALSKHRLSSKLKRITTFFPIFYLGLEGWNYSSS